MSFSVFLAGLMADKFGNYTAGFLMAGGVGILGSFIHFIFSCVKRESEGNIDLDTENGVKPESEENIDLDSENAVNQGQRQDQNANDVVVLKK